MKEPASFSNMIARREMLRRCLRGGGLASLGGLVVWLGARSIRSGCTRANPCGECPLFTDCGESKARDARESREDPGRGVMKAAGPAGAGPGLPEQNPISNQRDVSNHG